MNEWLNELIDQVTYTVITYTACLKNTFFFSLLGYAVAILYIVLCPWYFSWIYALLLNLPNL